MYKAILKWSQHPNAPYYLGGVSVVEAVIFPLPPDVMLVPMILSKPEKAWRYATITVIGSILGGILGYMLGYWLFDAIAKPLVELWGYENAYSTAVKWFKDYGFLAICIAGFTPIPYKLFTIAAGVTHMPIPLFILGAVLGRSMRFFIVAWLVRRFGADFETVVLKFLNKLSRRVL